VRADQRLTPSPAVPAVTELHEYRTVANPLGVTGLFAALTQRDDPFVVMLSVNHFKMVRFVVRAVPEAATE